LPRLYCQVLQPVCWFSRSGPSRPKNKCVPAGDESSAAPGAGG
jgi:hypothetical protein